MTDVYPGIDDWDRHVLDGLPGMARAGQGADWSLGLVSTMGVTEMEIEGIAREVADIEVAGLYVARAMAYRYNINPSGIELAELRRLVAGARAALACDGTDSRMHAMWVALTGSTDVTVRRLTSSGSYMAVLEGRVGFEPTTAYLAQAGAIVRRCVAVDAEVEAVVYLDGSFLFDDGPGFDVGLLSYLLPTG